MKGFFAADAAAVEPVIGRHPDAEDYGGSASGRCTDASEFPLSGYVFVRQGVVCPKGYRTAKIFAASDVDVVLAKVLVAVLVHQMPLDCDRFLPHVTNWTDLVGF